jgi:hypothetical protein
MAQAQKSPGQEGGLAPALPVDGHSGSATVQMAFPTVQMTFPVVQTTFPVVQTTFPVVQMTFPVA